MSEKREMSNYHKHAVEEMRRLGYQFDDEGYPISDPDDDFDINAEMAMCVLEILDVFGRQGHSGMSASHCLQILEKVMRFEPVTPLTGDDDEWTEVSSFGGGDEMKWQNKRCGRVFKQNDGRAYDIEGKVFWEWYTGEDGERRKSHYTCRESRVYVDFPYMPTTVYEERVSGAEG